MTAHPSLRMREQTEGRRLNLKEHCPKKKKKTGQRRLQELECGQNSSKKQRGFGQKQ